MWLIHPKLRRGASLLQILISFSFFSLFFFFFCRDWDCRNIISWYIVTSYGQMSYCATSQTSYLRKYICSASWCLLEFLSQCFESFPKSSSFVHLTECISSLIYFNTFHMPSSINSKCIFHWLNWCCCFFIAFVMWHLFLFCFVFCFFSPSTPL